MLTHAPALSPAVLAAALLCVAGSGCGPCSPEAAPRATVSPEVASFLAEYSGARPERLAREGARVPEDDVLTAVATSGPRPHRARAALFLALNGGTLSPAIVDALLQSNDPEERFSGFAYRVVRAPESPSVGLQVVRGEQDRSTRRNEILFLRDRSAYRRDKAFLGLLHTELASASVDDVTVAAMRVLASLVINGPTLPVVVDDAKPYVEKWNVWMRQNVARLKWDDVRGAWSSGG